MSDITKGRTIPLRMENLESQRYQVGSDVRLW